jgi:hypothetical protein
MVITRIAPLSCARIAGTLYAIVGFVAGAFFSLISLAGGFAAQNSLAGSRGLGALIGTASIILFPICYGLIGFLTSLIGAWLYNVLAGMVGGIQMDVGSRLWIEL